VTLAVQADLHEGLAHADAATGKIRRLQSAGKIRFFDPREPLLFQHLSSAVLCHYRFKRLGNNSLIIHHKRKPLAQVNPKAVRDQHVMQECSNSLILRSDLMLLDRIHHRRVSVRLMLEQIAEHRKHCKQYTTGTRRPPRVPFVCAISGRKFATAAIEAKILPVAASIVDNQEVGDGKVAVCKRRFRISRFIRLSSSRPMARK